MDPFASHPLRALLVLLIPTLLPAEQRASTLRSKKSAAYKARQGPMKSVFSNGQKTGEVSPDTPPEFKKSAGKFVQVLREQLGANEVRALAASQVASPVLQVSIAFHLTLLAHISRQMLLEIEAEEDRSYEPDSLSDRVLDSLITQQCMRIYNLPL